MSEKQFIQKIEKQNGWVNHLDALQLIHFYTLRFGIKYTKLGIEGELMYMWEKLKLNNDC